MTHSRQAQILLGINCYGLFTPDEKVPSTIKPGSALDNPYFWRPEEMQAFQTEKNRIASQNQPFARDPMTQQPEYSTNYSRKQGINVAPHP